MKVKTVHIDDQTRDVLLRSRIEGTFLFLPEQLPRDEYDRVAKAIKAAGGKWDRKAGCHVFLNDVRKTLNIGAETIEVVNVQQTFQAFYTPPEIVHRMAALAQVERHHRFLEPSAGTGRILEAIWTRDIRAVEIDPALAEALRVSWPDAGVTTGDFLSLGESVLGRFDRIVMNPPFTQGQDVAHILHARSLLRPGGRLVAICGNGPKQRAVLEPLAAVWIELPSGAFKKSGTNVATAIVVIDN